MGSFSLFDRNNYTGRSALCLVLRPNDVSGYFPHRFRAVGGADGLAIGRAVERIAGARPFQEFMGPAFFQIRYDGFFLKTIP